MRSFYRRRGLRLLPALMQWRPLAAVGAVSHGLYLWHPAVFSVVQRLGTDWTVPTRLATAGIATAVFT
ncbi:MAG: hypothetical protein JWM72_1121 [Actinomycetia bacterium]|nr:hypothetical protein [Actinomycetes bacterium]